jgi:hypothetical protein
LATLCFIACSNGLGHFKRVALVCDALLEIRPDADIDIVCRRWQIQRLESWPVLTRLERARVTFRELDTVVRWSNLTASSHADSLRTWSRALEGLGLDRFDVVVSDNLVEPLLYRSDSVLMGSFLWSDLIRRSAVHRRFGAYAQACDEILSEHEPAMISNRYFAMPAVVAQTRSVPVGFIDPAPTVTNVKASSLQGETRPRRVLLYPGSSPSTTELMAAWVDETALGGPGAEAWQLFASEGFRSSVQRAVRIVPFGFGRQDFSEIDLVVGRPGMGILMDCVASRTPIMCVPEDDPEMAHNAQVIHDLEIGVRLRELRQAQSVATYFANERVATGLYDEALDALDRDGLTQSAAYLSELCASA